MIKNHEGFCLSFYGDPKGYPTVGWGHCISQSYTYTKNTSSNLSTSLLTTAEATALKNALGLSYSSPITQSQADTFFNNDTASAVNAVNKLSLPAGHSFSVSQFDALVSMTFNCGSGVLQTSDVVAMLANTLIYPTYSGTRTTAQNDTCSRLVSNASRITGLCSPAETAKRLCSVRTCRTHTSIRFTRCRQFLHRRQTIVISYKQTSQPHGWLVC